MTEFVDPRLSHSILEKIKLFEGAAPTPNAAQHLGKSPSLSSLRSWLRDGKVMDRHSLGSNSLKNASVSIREEESRPIAPVSLQCRSQPKETKKEPITLVVQTEDNREKDNTKGKKKDSDELEAVMNTLPHDKTPQISPRTKQKERVIRLEVDSDDDDIVTLQQLSVEEKEVVKSLIRITKKESVTREKQAIVGQFDAEKTVWKKEMQRIEKDLAMANEQINHYENINTALQNKLRVALEDLQETRTDLEEAQIAIAKYQRVLADYKKNTDTELSNKSRTLEYMDKKLGALSKLRESMECVICEERVAKIILNPCHHLSLCSVCSHLVSQCPMCRAPITSRFEIYSNWIL